LGGQGDDEWDEMVTYRILNDIYTDILRTMGDVDGSLKLKGDSQKNISEALEKIKGGEEEYRNSMKSLIQKYRLYRASNGRIDPTNINDDDLAELLKKHSNLFHLAQALNKHSIRLIDVLRTLIKIVDEKEEEKAKGKKQTYNIFGENGAAPVSLPPAPSTAPVGIQISRPTIIRTGGALKDLSPNDITHPFNLAGVNWLSIQEYVQTQRILGVNHAAHQAAIRAAAQTGSDSLRTTVDAILTANPAQRDPAFNYMTATETAYRAQLADPANAALQTLLKGTKGRIVFEDANDIELGQNSAGTPGNNFAGKVLKAIRARLDVGMGL